MSNMMKYFKATLTSVTKQQTRSRTVVLMRMPRLCLIMCVPIPNNLLLLYILCYMVSLQTVQQKLMCFFQAIAVSQLYITLF